MRKAILYMLISTFTFALLSILVKNLLQFNVFQIVFFTALGTLFFTIPILLKKNISFLGNKRVLLLSRSIVGVVSMLFFFISLKYLTTGTAVAIRYTSPIFAAILALFLLKEKIKPIQWLFFLIAFSGVLLVKGVNNTESLGILYAILSALFAALVYFFIRKIGDADHPTVIVNYFMIVSVIIGGLLSIKNWITPIGIEWLQLLSLGVVGYIAQLYMTKALQKEKLNQIAPLKYIEVVFTILIGIIFINEKYTVISIIGIFLIAIGLILNFFVGAKN